MPTGDETEGALAGRDRRVAKYRACSVLDGVRMQALKGAAMIGAGATCLTKWRPMPRSSNLSEKIVGKSLAFANFSVDRPLPSAGGWPAPREGNFSERLAFHRLVCDSPVPLVLLAPLTKVAAPFYPPRGFSITDPARTGNSGCSGRIANACQVGTVADH
jgi:hypothetical protein